jgi:hypothetical protein
MKNDMRFEGSGFPEGERLEAPDFITGRFHDQDTYKTKIMISIGNRGFVERIICRLDKL